MILQQLGNMLLKLWNQHFIQYGHMYMCVCVCVREREDIGFFYFESTSTQKGP